MTSGHITTLVVYSIFMFFFSISSFLLFNKHVFEKQFKKFYCCPIITYYKSCKLELGNVFTWATTILYFIIWLPIEIVWFIAWCGYKLYKVLENKFINDINDSILPIGGTDADCLVGFEEQKTEVLDKAPGDLKEDVQKQDTDLAQ